MGLKARGEEEWKEKMEESNMRKETDKSDCKTARNKKRQESKGK